MTGNSTFFNARRDIRRPSGLIHSACRRYGLARTRQSGQDWHEIAAIRRMSVYGTR